MILGAMTRSSTRIEAVTVFLAQWQVARGEALPPATAAAHLAALEDLDRPSALVRQRPQAIYRA
jgi:hypothetical protein